jgi:GNAT superfamily N-acetyltransferase
VGGTRAPASLHDLVDADLSDGTRLALGPLPDAARGALFELFADVVERRDGYPHEPPLTEEVFVSVWGGPATVIGARVAPRGWTPADVLPAGALVGAYYLRPNFPGRAAHIANAGYVVSREARGRGVGRALVTDSIARAPLAGFDAVQFNLVFASNPGRRLYEELGWREIGRIPAAVDGEDAIVYWRAVGQSGR